MTSMGCGDQYEYVSTQTKEALGEALLAKTEAENLLKETALPWVIVRPGGLSNEPPFNNYEMAVQCYSKKGSYLARGDVAEATLEVLSEPKYLRKIVTITAKK